MGLSWQKLFMKIIVVGVEVMLQRLIMEHLGIEKLGVFEGLIFLEGQRGIFRKLCVRYSLSWNIRFEKLFFIFLNGGIGPKIEEDISSPKSDENRVQIVIDVVKILYISLSQNGGKYSNILIKSL